MASEVVDGTARTADWSARASALCPGDRYPPQGVALRPEPSPAKDDHESVARTRMATIERGNMEHSHVRTGIASAVMAVVLVAVTVSGYA